MNEQHTIIVPFADLYRQYQSIKDEIDQAIRTTIETSAYIRGPSVDAFELEFAKTVGSTHCISCANGTDALYIAMKSLNVRPGDEVIVPAMSWISSSETVTQAGASVVFCDIDSETNTISIPHLESLITPRTVGIIAVHLYGHPADLISIQKIAERHSLWVIEDCAQSHLCELNGRMVGTFGVAATFSFYPGKNLGAMGDAGAILTNSKDLALKMAKYARHGGLHKGDHEIEGINSRLDGLQAAVLNVKLRHLKTWTDARIALANRYSEELSTINDLTCPFVSIGAKHVWHLYVVKTNRRNALAAHLKENGIQTSINYPRALPFLPCYSHLSHKNDDFPNAYSLQNTGISLPLFPEMTEAEFERVCSSIHRFFQ